MERISDKELERTLRHITISRDLGVTECAISPDDLDKIMQEIKDRRAADNKIAENIKKEMVIFCKNFEDRRNHSTICHPPDDEECVMLSFCESMENILEAGSTSKQSLPVEPAEHDSSRMAEYWS